MIESLPDKLTAELRRVRGVRDIYKTLEGQPQVNVAPALWMMERAITAGENALACGEIQPMLAALEDLKGWEE